MPHVSCQQPQTIQSRSPQDMEQHRRRIRNRTRRLHKQSVYRHIKCSKEHTSQPYNEHQTHMQGEAKCDETEDRNAATQHKPDHHRDTHSQKRKAAHHRRSASALFRRWTKTKHTKYTSTTQPCPHGTPDAQLTYVVPTKVLCINACNCCSHALSYREMTYSGTIYLNIKREETIVPMHTYRGGSQRPHIPDGEPDLGPNPLDLYTPLSGSGREWLSNIHILNVCYVLHIQYPDAKHQNMEGVTHPVPSVQELLHKVKQADENSPLEYNTVISQAMRDALSPDGPSPAITSGDKTHWRVMLINTRRKHVDFVDPFGTGFLYS